MKHRNAPGNQTRRRILSFASGSALALALTVSLPTPAHADRVTPPPVPAEIQVPEGSRAFLEGHAVGTQNYVCLPSGIGFAWSLFTPEATLFRDNGRQITTHFFSPNPVETGIVRAAWQHSRDTSTVWGQAIHSSSDPGFVAAGAIPWLLIKVVGAQYGPTGGDKLTAATHIQRLNTWGGAAPATGCSQLPDVGKRAFVPYTADYFFYTEGESDEDDDQ
jgi:hypothetical protein